MDPVESPTSSDSAHTPLQDEHVGRELSEEIPVNIEIGENEEMIEEQLDYEEFIENNEVPKPESEAEEGEYDSGDDNDVVLCENNDDKKSLENGELNSDDETTISKPVIRNFSREGKEDDEVLSKCDGELAEGELKAEEEEIPIEETPWERGLRLARERRELAKLKKVQEKDKLKEKQLHINLDNIEEVEPISKPQIEKNYEMNQQLLKAMQPIVILPEEPRHNEMIMEYYLAESDYQHRPRFIPSRLYTLDPWEVEEWKRELDMMKLESEKGKIASNKHKRISGGNQAKRIGRRGSVSSSVSSRSSSLSDGGKAGVLNQSTRQYEFQTSQYALSRSKPVLDKFNKPNINESINKLHVHRGKQRDLPPEFKNRVISSSRSSSRSSSGSHSSSSGSSSSSRSTSSPRRISPKKHKPTVNVQKTSTIPTFRTIKKPALGRARSDSSGSSKSSDSSSTSSDSSSSRSSNSSGDSKTKTRKNKTDKQFISSWFTKTPQNPLEATVVQESVGTKKSSAVASGNKSGGAVNGADDETMMISDTNTVGHQPAIMQQSISFDNESQLPSVGTRPGVKLKLVSRPKPVILPSQQTSGSKSTKTATNKDSKSSKKQSIPQSKLNESTTPAMTTSNIFNNNKSIFSSSAAATAGNTNKTSSATDLQLSSSSQSTKESALKSNLAATQLEMQQEFLRNYKDKIAIYRSQLSYQQQNPLSGQHPSTLTHGQPPPIKGPITVMSVTSKKTGPPKTQMKVTDRYSQHEEHSRRYNHHYSPNYRSDFRDNATSGNSNNNNNNNNSFGGNRNRHGSRNRSRSFDNDRTDWGRSRGGGGDRDYHGRSNNNNNNNRNYDGAAGRDYNNDSGKYRQPDSSSSYRSSRNNEFGGGNNNNSSNNNRSSYNNDNNKYRDQHDNNIRNRYDAPSSGAAGRHDYDSRSNRFDRDDDRPRRGDDRSNNNSIGGGGRGGRDYNRYNNKDSSFSRDDRSRGDRYHRDSDRDYEDRFSENSAVDKRGGGGDSDKYREDKFDSGNSKPRPRNLDRDSLTDSITTTSSTAVAAATNPDNSNKPAAAAMATLPSVPKEKRREELLKQLKAVEDAIAKKKAKIDK